MLEIPRVTNVEARERARGKAGAMRLAVRANHFPAKIGLETVYHYDVKFKFQTRFNRKELLFRAFDEFKKSCGRFLKFRFSVVFDGAANAYSAVRLPFGSGDTFTGSVTVLLALEEAPQRMEKIEITMILVREVDMARALEDFCNSGSSTTRPQVVIWWNPVKRITVGPGILIHLIQ